MPSLFGMAFLFQLVFPLLPEEGIKGRREKSLANNVYLVSHHPGFGLC